ncbi:WbqC family protein [Streptomyces microflavus]|uniref:WbqC family protein n=1 Tax=Streptomyces microflavus TaxID=1919 RepID=UPI003320310C|nr:WbqC family protein [Streptomyces microflavus]WST13127.1 WbqC family protein [Streptomyces microflavus]
MRVAAHQPGYHRHLYYFYKMAISDAFVSLDHVQFVRSDWQNRQVFVYEDARRWLTVPVQGSRGVIRSKVIAHPSVLPSHWDRIKSIYRSTPYFSTYEAALGEIYGASWKYLNDLCDALTEVARSGFGITTPYLRASDLVEDPKTAKGEMLADVALRAASAMLPPGREPVVTYLACLNPVRQDHYLRQPSRENPAFMEHEVMENRGVRVRAFDYLHPSYEQTQHAQGRPFQAELTAYDLLFNHGPKARDILLGANPEERPKLYRIGGK